MLSTAQLLGSDADQDDKVCTATIIKLRQERTQLRASKPAARPGRRQRDAAVPVTVAAPPMPPRTDQEIFEFARQALATFVLSPPAARRAPRRSAPVASVAVPSAPKKTHPAVVRVLSTEAASSASKRHATVVRRLSFSVDDVLVK